MLLLEISEKAFSQIHSEDSYNNYREHERGILDH